jgi:ABC-2 type transport system ATP-binding protein
MQTPVELGPPAVELLHVSKSFGSRRVLSDLHLQVRAGEMVVLLGPNGAGKTTALSLILGLRAPSDGIVRVGGQNPRHYTVRSRIGGMVQGSGFPAPLSVAELLVFFESLHYAPLPSRDVIRLVGLEGRAGCRAAKLSTGEKQRLLLGIALIGDPAVLILDEPTISMDVDARVAFWRLMRALTNRGRTVLLSTHHPDEADALADRVVLLHGGRILTIGRPDEIRSATGEARLEDAAVALIQRASGEHP